ncbi:hypothetical protein [Gallaecimonas pentaromativorans]|uniref:hypothetical protein n=1 Tax=Gallaecimonas pentaromativorans TaxID=584787 RepID=UPI003A954080
MLPFSRALFSFAFGASLVAGCQANTAEQGGYDMEATSTLNAKVGDSTFIYQQFDPEFDFPCPVVSLQKAGKTLVSKELCVYKARDNSPFDLRNDVSYNAISDTAINGNTLSYTLDISLRRADAFLQKCTLTFTADSLSEPNCVLEDLPPAK